jgi:hypothetical protein
MRRRKFPTLAETVALIATCSLALGAAPAERPAQPEALRDVSPAAMALDGAKYRQALEDGRSAEFTVQP